jgi:hypothetical protein
MLTYDDLVALEHELRDVDVLSAYINTAIADPAHRHQWWRCLEKPAAELRAAMSDAPGRDAFERAAALLRERLQSMETPPRLPGWVAFVTADGIRYAEGVPAPVPSLITWEQGIRVAPYLRAIKQQRPALIAVLDARQARIFRYQRGALEAVDTLHAEERGGPPIHMGTPPNAGYHTGTRGATGTDEAARQQRVSRERMMRDVAERLAAEAGQDAWIVLGGIAQAAADAGKALPATLQGRVRLVDGLDVHATEAEIARMAEQASMTQQRAHDVALVDALVSNHAADGLGRVGLAATLWALEHRSVAQLYFTDHFSTTHAADADRVIQSAFDQRAAVRHLSGDAADRLNAAGEGVGVTLRFAVGAPQPLREEVGERHADTVTDGTASAMDKPGVFVPPPESRPTEPEALA